MAWTAADFENGNSILDFKPVIKKKKTVLSSPLPQPEIKPNFAMLDRVTPEDTKQLADLEEYNNFQNSTPDRMTGLMPKQYNNSLIQRDLLAAADKPANVFTRSMGNSMLLGLPDAMSSRNTDSFQQKLYEAQQQGRENNRVADIAGSLVGSISPWMAAENAVARVGGKFLAPAIAKEGAKLTAKESLGNLGKRAIIGTGAGALTGGAEAASRYDTNKSVGENLGDIGTNAAIGAGLGLGGELVGAGIGRLFKGKNGQVANNAIKEMPAEELNSVGMPKPSSNIVSSGKSKGFDLKGNWNKFYTRFIDTQKPISDFSKLVGDNTSTLASNSRNVGGTVDYILQSGLVDRSGKKIGDSLKSIIEKIPKNKEGAFWEYMLQKHNIARSNQGKAVYANYTPEMSAEAVAKFESANPEFKEAASNVNKFMNDFMQEWGNKSGLVSDDLWKSLRETYPNYIPTNRDFSELEKNMPEGLSRQFIDVTSPIKKATGSERDITHPVENIMNLVNRTVRKARYNEVGQSLVDSIRKQPDRLKGLAEIIKPKDGMFSNLDNIVTIMESGKPTYLQVNDKNLLDALKNINKNSNDFALAKKATNIFKSLITQKNPIFAIRNIARDIPTAYIYGSEKNPLRFGKDLLSAGKDLLANSEAAQQYKALGGGGANFFNSGNVAKSAKELTGKENIFKKIGNGIEAFNNLTESAPRLAEFKRVSNKTGDAQKGLYAANEVTTNFARGGDITKKYDAIVPYLNAGIQGLDKLARSINPKNPKVALGTLVKSGVAITVPSLFFHYINQGNPNYEALDERTKDNYFLIPNGNKFIKIPKSRELGVLFGSLFERTSRVLEGRSNPFKGFGGTVFTNFSPANPVENNIFSPLTYNLPTNKDFAGRSIVPENMKERSNSLQYDEKTSEIAKKIGELTNLSPKQIDYVIRSYTGVVGQLGLPAATKGTYNEDALTNIAKPVINQFVADPTYSNSILTDFYDNKTELEKKAADKNFTKNVPSKIVTPEERLRNKFDKATKDISAINKKVRQAELKGDSEEVKALRVKMLDIAKKTNDMLK